MGAARLALAVPATFIVVSVVQLPNGCVDVAWLARADRFEAERRTCPLGAGVGEVEADPAFVLPSWLAVALERAWSRYGHAK